MGNNCASPRSGKVENASRRRFLKGSTVAVTVGMSGVSGCIGGLGSGGSETPIRLGAAFPFTGAYSKEAETQRQGVELAVKEINNNGGLLDRDIETFWRDTELDGGVSQRRIQDLIANENIDLLVASLSGAISLQTNELAKRTDTPYMAGCQTVPEFHKPDILYDCSYTPYALNVQSQRANARYIMDNLGDSVFGIYADYAWGQSSWNYQKKAIRSLGGTIVGEAPAPLGNDNFTSQINEASKSGAEVLYIMNMGSDQANSITQARSFGLHKKMELFVGVTTVTVALRAGRDQWEDINAGIYYTASADNPQTNKFAGKMEKEFGNPGDSYSAVTYTSVKEFQRAVEGGQSLAPEDITAQINANPEFAVTKTPEKWRDCDNQSIQDWYIVSGKAVSEQEDKWDIFEAASSPGGKNLLLDCSAY